MNAVLEATANGELAPDEAANTASLIETRRRTMEAVDLDSRLVKLEQITRDQGTLLAYEEPPSKETA